MKVNSLIESLMNRMNKGGSKLAGQEDRVKELRLHPSKGYIYKKYKHSIHDPLDGKKTKCISYGHRRRILF